MDYKIISYEREDEEELIMFMETEINDYCKAGWNPQGGISIVKEKSGPYKVYKGYQAIVKL